MRRARYIAIVWVLALTACHSDSQGASPDPTTGAAGVELTTQQAFRAAVVRGDAKAAASAIDAGADVNLAVLGTTALHIAADNGDVGMVNLLASHGADVTAQDTSGDTALHIAARDDDGPVISELLGDGADVEAQGGYWGTTPLALAALAGSTTAMAALVDAGAPVDQDSTGKGDTALILASCWGTLTSVVWLVDHQASPVAHDNHGYDVLRCATANGHDDITTYLNGLGVTDQ